MKYYNNFPEYRSEMEFLYKTNINVICLPESNISNKQNDINWLQWPLFKITKNINLSSSNSDYNVGGSLYQPGGTITILLLHLHKLRNLGKDPMWMGRWTYVSLEIPSIYPGKPRTLHIVTIYVPTHCLQIVDPWQQQKTTKSPPLPSSERQNSPPSHIQQLTSPTLKMEQKQRLFCHKQRL